MIAIPFQKIYWRNSLFLTGWAVSALLVIFGYRQVLRTDLRFWTGIVTHGNPARREIALTFDDGPHPLWTPLEADSLRRHGARGTFMLVGEQATYYPEITARLIRDGHEVENHSLSHPYPNLTVFPAKDIRKEICESATILHAVTGQPTLFFRPPGGGVNDDLLRVLETERTRMAWWSANMGDWRSPPPEETQQILHASLRPGLIVLMHCRGNTVAALEEFLAGSGREDYTYTTLSSLMRP